MQRNSWFVFAIPAILVFAASLVPACIASVALAQAKKKAKKAVAPKPVDLIDPKTFPKGWHFQAKPGTARTSVWTINLADKKDPVLICKGHPQGYLRTEKTYKDFELTLEWMYHNAGCNSGILLNIVKPDKIWPAAIQVQLHRPKVGSIIKTRDPVAKLPEPKNRMPANLLPIKEWHKCKITSLNGTITVWINGKKVNEVSEFEPKEGCIALQSNLSEIHFRRVQIREMKPAAAATKAKSKKKKKKKTNKPKEKNSKTPAS